MKMKYKIKKAYIFPVLLAVFIIRPYNIQIYPRLNAIWAYITATLALLSIYKTRSAIKEGEKIIALLVAFYAYCIFYAFATARNEVDNIFSALSECAQMIGGFNLGLLSLVPDYKKSVAHAIYKVFTGYLYLDVLWGFLNIGALLGTNRNMTFLGYDNFAVYCILPMIAIKFAINYQKRGKIQWKDWFCWLICLLYKIQTMSFNGIIFLTLFGLVCYIAMHRVDLKKIFTPKNAVIISVLLVFGVSIFNIHNVFSDILVSLGKGTTLGARTIIWSHTIPALFSVPLWGYGHINNGSFQTIVGLNPVWDAEGNHAHNLLMELWFTNGIIGLILYISIINICAKWMKRKWCNNTYKLLGYGVTTYILMGFIDGYPHMAVSYTLLSLLFCAGVQAEMREYCLQSCRKYRGGIR